MKNSHGFPAKYEEDISVLGTESKNKGVCTHCGRELPCQGAPEPVMVSHEKNCSLKTKEWLTSKEAAQYLGLSERSLFNLTSNGKIPYYKFGRRNRYLLNELKELLLLNRRGVAHGY